MAQVTLTQLVLSVAIIFNAASTPGMSQQPAATAPAPIGEQAVKVILKHYTLLKDPKTGQVLPRDGAWSLSKATPAACPSAQSTCVEVIYRVPAQSVQCKWTEVLNPDGKDGEFLDENDDTVRYWLREVNSAEAKALVSGRVDPLYPPIAQAAHLTGEVMMNAVIDQSGQFESLDYASGPTTLKGASLEAAKLWKFMPMKVGTRNVPYRIQMVFSFSGMGNFARVEVIP
jgi:hypothetical protein